MMIMMIPIVCQIDDTKQSIRIGTLKTTMICNKFKYVILSLGLVIRISSVYFWRIETIQI